MGVYDEPRKVPLENEVLGYVILRSAFLGIKSEKQAYSNEPANDGGYKVEKVHSSVGVRLKVETTSGGYINPATITVISL